LFFAVLFFGISFAAAQQTANSSDWHVEVAANDLTRSTVTANNDCQRPHQFQIQPDHLPFLNLLGEASFQVPPRSQHIVPVEFDTHHMKPGSYEAKLTVRCMTCKTEPTCRQDYKDLHIFLTVRPGAPDWSGVHPEEKGSAKNPALRWSNVSPDKKPKK
jgi:hypothetical protein